MEQHNSQSEKGMCYKSIHNIRWEFKPKKNKFYEEERKGGINGPTVDEIDLTTNKLIYKRVAVLDNIKAELFKFWKLLFLDALLQFETRIFDSRKIPEMWEGGIICSGHKKGDPVESRHYRDITLLYTAHDVSSSVLPDKWCFPMSATCVANMEDLIST